MNVLYLYHVTVQYFPVLDPKKVRIFSVLDDKVQVHFAIVFNDNLSRWP